MALAVRELQTNGIPKPSWVNSHLVYTHGYGIVAAPTTRVDPSTESPVYYDGGMPPSQEIPVTRPQVYFGQAFGSRRIRSSASRPAARRRSSSTTRAGSGSAPSAYTTYHGHGGIPIGSTLRRLLFAIQLHDPNIFFSSEINAGSQLLMLRSPGARIAKVAPWLTLDGDIYPAVVNGQIKWIADGYTTTSNYPNSQTINLHSATSTTLTSHGASVAQPNTQINYMHNSVKAVVDAYTGKVSLYEWNQSQQPDPLLKAWEGVYPGLVKPQSDIPSALLPQLRYPTDLFNVQRSLLAKYHVAGASDFYSGNDFWAVPSDPTVAAAKALNKTSGGSASHAEHAVEVHLDVGHWFRRSALLAVQPDGDAQRTPARVVHLGQLRTRARLRQVHGAEVPVRTDDRRIALAGAERHRVGHQDHGSTHPRTWW